MQRYEARLMVKELTALRARLDAAFEVLGDDESADTAALETVRLSLHNINSASQEAIDTLRRELGA